MTAPADEASGAAVLKLAGRRGRLWQLLDRRDRIRFALLFIAMMIGAAVELVSLASLQLYAALLAGGGGGGAAVPSKFAAILELFPSKPSLTALTVGMVGLLVLKLFVFAGIFWAIAATLASWRIRLSARLFKAYQYAPYDWHLLRSSADLLRGLREDVTETVAGAQQLLQFLLNLVTAIAICVFLILALPSPVLIGLLLTSALFIAISVHSHRLLTAASKRQRKESRNSIKAIQQGFGALTEARILGRRKWFLRSFRQAMTGVASAHRQRVFIQQSMPMLVETVLLIAMMLMIAAIVRLSSSLEAALQIATALALAVFRLRQVLSKTTVSLNKISSSAPSSDALIDDLGKLAQYAPAGPDDEGEPAGQFENLKFDRVVFSFPGQQDPALDAVSFAIARGEHVAIVGSTGAGKSTLVALALGLLEPSEGQVLVDGHALPSRLRQWHSRIGYVPQSVYLIDDTVAANVALGMDADKIDRERVWEVLELAGLATHLKGLPDGIDTQAGEQGSWLSGGQQQRVGIARALYHRPEVLILDEATSALDRQTESAILKALYSFPGELTIIAITHRMESVKFADHILLLSHGRLAAEGTYQELVANSAEFREVTQLDPERRTD